jgi:hypothetical protein
VYVQAVEQSILFRGELGKCDALQYPGPRLLGPDNSPAYPQTDATDIALSLDHRSGGNAAIEAQRTSARREIVEDPSDADLAIRGFSLNGMPGGIPRRAPAIRV